MAEESPEVKIARCEERIDALFRLDIERQKAISLAHEAQLAVNKTQNEFRGALDDAAKTAANTQATKSELNTLKDLVVTHATRTELESVLNRVLTLERASAANMGKSTGITAAQSMIFSVITLLIAAVSVIWAFMKS